mgnify:FL=1
MVKGVTSKEETIIKEILREYPYEFYYYGSRVKGDYTKSSDLDILIKSDTPIPTLIMNELSTKFNESKIPYIVNFSDFNLLEDNFIKHIQPTLVKI